MPGLVPSSPANQDFKGGFGGFLMVKDLGLATSAAEATGVDAPFTHAALDIYKQVAEAYPRRDFSVVIEQIRSRSKTRSQDARG